jgi:ferredoxin
VHHSARIDKQSCLASGRCTQAAPDAFGGDADHLGEVLPGVERLSRRRLLEIARGCPALAITVQDERGRVLELEG